MQTFSVQLEGSSVFLADNESVLGTHETPELWMPGEWDILTYLAFRASSSPAGSLKLELVVEHFVPGTGWQLILTQELTEAAFPSPAFSGIISAKFFNPSGEGKTRIRARATALQDAGSVSFMVNLAAFPRVGAVAHTE